MLVCPRRSFSRARIRVGSNSRRWHSNDHGHDTKSNPESQSSSTVTGSAKLFQDAKHGDTPRSKSSYLQTLESQAQQGYKNWDGEESLQDAVLRMLVDKYKPLRTGQGVQTAEEKMKRPGGIPNVKQDADWTTPFDSLGHTDEEEPFVDVRTERPGQSKSLIRTASAPMGPLKLKPTTTGSWASEPLLQGDENHRPWHTTFKPPSHSQASIKFADIHESTSPLSVDSSSFLPPSALPLPASSNPKKASSHTPKDDKTRRLERKTRKRTEYAGRLSRACESTLDYKMGVTPSMKDTLRQTGRVNPITMKGWTGLVEDQIEKARSKGLFNSIQGRGQPLTKSKDDFNPFIAREEYLMNRIVQRNGALPPWIELQAELESSITTFRQLLRDAWTRRALRILLGTTPCELLHTITVRQVKELRDEEWFKRERKYHETALEEVNRVVKNYNAVAPYVVRRPNYVLDVEIEKVMQECIDDIVKEVKDRVEDVKVGGHRGAYYMEAEEVEFQRQGEDKSRYGFREFVQELLAMIRIGKPN